jgi:hypothetical protein
VTDRISCCVPFCHRTRGNRKGDPLTPTMEWLCQDHWRLVPPRLKQRRAKLRRIEKRSSDPCIELRVEHADSLVWEACKRHAIERAAGI